MLAWSSGERLAPGHQKIQRNHIGAIAVPQFARDVAVHAAVVDVVAAARQHQPRLARLFQHLQRAPARRQQLLLEFALRR